MPIFGQRAYSNIIKKFIKLGAKAENMTLQLAIFGSSFKRVSSLSSTSCDIVSGQPESAGCGSFLIADGLLTNAEKSSLSNNLHTQQQICRIKRDLLKWTLAEDVLQKTPYAFTANDWMSFDNFDSFKIKVHWSFLRTFYQFCFNLFLLD